MNTQMYFRTVRELAEQMTEEDVVIVSKPTPDGGRAGVFTEAPRLAAARLVVDERARLATPEEAEEFRERRRLAYERAKQAEQAVKVPVAVLSETEIRRIRSEGRHQK